MKKRGRKKTTDKFADATSACSPLGVGLRIARLRRQGATYDQVLIFFKDILPPDYRLSKNTVDKYRKQYRQTISEPARKAGRDEEEFWKEFCNVKSAARLREMEVRLRDPDGTIKQIQSTLSAEELATEIVRLAQDEAARVRTLSIEADYLTITFNYRAPHEKKKG